MAADLAINTSALAGQASDVVSLRVLRMALDAQQSAGAQLAETLQPQPQPAAGTGRLVDVYA
ncbi:MAG TPA: YjfB family protein [Gaiellaceae bacterium]|jgi:hypothetical protein